MQFRQKNNSPYTEIDRKIPGVFGLALRDVNLSEEARKAFQALLEEHLDTSSQETFVHSFTDSLRYRKIPDKDAVPPTTVELSIFLDKDQYGKELFDALWPIARPDCFQEQAGLDKEKVWNFAGSNQKIRLFISYNFIEPALKCMGFNQHEIAQVRNKIKSMIAR